MMGLAVKDGGAGAVWPLPVVILAGGTGGRLAPFVDKVPKALIEVNGTPIIDRIIAQFRAQGCDEFWITTRYLAGVLERHFEGGGADSGVHLVSDRGHLGSAGPLRVVCGSMRTPFILSNCDVLADADYPAIARKGAENGDAITLIAYKHLRVIPEGDVEMGADGSFEGFSPRREIEELIYSGVSIVRSEALDHLGTDGKLNFTEFVVRCREAGQRVGVHTIDHGAWYDMGTFGALSRMSRALREAEGNRSGKG